MTGTADSSTDQTRGVPRVDTPFDTPVGTKAPPLEVRGVTRRFDDVIAVDDLSLTLYGSEIVALVGPSGCGKSTLLRSIAGMITIDSGTIHLDGRLVDDGSAHLPPERRSAGLVFQDHALFPHLTVRDNVAFGIRDRGATATRERVAQMLSIVSLAAHADRFPHELSGGERQRVAVARALAPEPALMLFDEPFASLDHNLRVALRRQVLDALARTQTPAVFVTHDQNEALALGDRIAVMRAGRIEQIGTPAEVFHEPKSAFIAAFMGDASFLPASRHQGHWSSALGPLEADPGASPSALVQAMVRPDDVEFSPAPDGPATVIDIEYHGTDWLVTTEIDGATVLLTRTHLDPLEIGERGVLALTPGHRQVALAAEPT